jgi:hypothetical protein
LTANGDNGNGMRRKTWRPPGVTDHAKPGSLEEEHPGKPASALEAVEYWQRNGVAFRVETLGMENIETGEVVYEKRPRVVVDNVPMSLLTGAEWGAMRRFEARIIEHLGEAGEEGGGPRA